MQRLEAAVVEEKLTPAIVAKQDQKAIEEKKTKWKSGSVFAQFPNYTLIAEQLHNDRWSAGALEFALKAYESHALLFDRANRGGRLYVENLLFESYGDHVKCDGFIVFKNGKITKAFKKFIT